MLLSVADGSAASGRLCVPPATDIGAEFGHMTRAERQDRPPLTPIFQNQLPLLTVFIMSQTQVATPDHSPAAPTFTQAAVRFAVSFAALIGLSLLLAGL
jgi:hypothetical protein